MSDKKLLENEDLSKVNGGVDSDNKHIYSVGDYVEYTYNDALYCCHIRALYTSPESYKVNKAVKKGNTVSYVNTGMPFDGGPKNVQKTVYKECPAWCPNLR